MARVSDSVHGVLLLDKPYGVSSNQALQRARFALGAAKAGHTGSLDPLATGMLPLCFGEATKVAGLLLGSHKRYFAVIVLGSATSTDDTEGEIVSSAAVTAEMRQHAPVLGVHSAGPRVVPVRSVQPDRRHVIVDRDPRRAQLEVVRQIRHRAVRRCASAHPRSRRARSPRAPCGR